MALNKKMEELRKTLEAKINAYVTGYNAHDKKKKELDPLAKAVKVATDEYNENLATETYKRWNAEGTPVMTAIRLRTVPHALKVRFKVDDEDTMVAVVEEDDKYDVSLPKLQAVIGADKFSYPNWLEVSNDLATLIAAKFEEHIEENPGFSLKMDKVKATFGFPEGMDPRSDEGFIHALQTTIDKILYLPNEDGSGNLIHIEAKTDSNGHIFSKASDVILNSFTGKGSKRSSMFVNGTGRMSGLVADAMHTILTGGEFGLEHRD